jgi:hypothetical protein
MSFARGVRCVCYVARRRRVKMQDRYLPSF